MPFGIGPGELILIAIVALLLFGPKKLPEIGRSIGESLGAFKRAMNSMAEPDPPALPASNPPVPAPEVPANSAMPAISSSTNEDAADTTQQAPADTVPQAPAGNALQAPPATATQAPADTATQSPPATHALPASESASHAPKN